MTKTAYLLAAIHEDGSWSVGTFSDRSPTTFNGRTFALITQASAPTYSEACDKLWDYVRTYHPWLEASR